MYELGILDSGRSYFSVLLKYYITYLGSSSNLLKFKSNSNSIVRFFCLISSDQLKNTHTHTHRDARAHSHIYTQILPLLFRIIARVTRSNRSKNDSCFSYIQKQLTNIHLCLRICICVYL